METGRLGHLGPLVCQGLALDRLALVCQRVGVREAGDPRLVAFGHGGGGGGGGVAQGVPQVPVSQPLQGQRFVQAPRRVVRGRQGELRRPPVQRGPRQLSLVGVQVGVGRG